MDHNQQSRRGHFHRGRRNPDRRGPDRRTPPPQAQEPSGRDHVDVEQIMRDIRSRIAQRHGIDLSNQQIHELAARRLEAILDPRTIKPGLLDELRRSAGTPPAQPDAAEASELTYAFEDTTLYESHRGVLRFIRRLLNPILKLFFNPNPLIQALNIQARWNADATRRQAERDRRQTEWNALHYELLHRMVTEVSRASLELQGMAAQVESLSAKVDFNERRVRGMEGSVQQVRPAPRSPEPVVSPAAASPDTSTADVPPAMPTEGTTSDGTRRRRRRRRGRRGSGAPGDAGGPQPPGQPGSALESGADAGGDDGPEDESGQHEQAPVTSAAPAPPADAPPAVELRAPEPAAPAPPAEEPNPEG